MEETYAERNAKQQRMAPADKAIIFGHEVRARESAIRTMFQLALDADTAEKEAAAAIPELGEGMDALKAFNAATDYHYYNTFFAPEIYASSVFLALFDFYNHFATSMLGFNEQEVLCAKAGSEVINGRTFHEVVVAVRSHLMHFHEQAGIASMEELLSKNPRAKPPVQVFTDLGMAMPLDSQMSFAILDMLSGRDFNTLLHYVKSVGPGLIALRHPTSRG